MKNCNHGDCFTCPYPDCIAEGITKERKLLTSEERKIRRKQAQARWAMEHKKERQEYMKKYYLEHKDKFAKNK